MVLLYLLVFLFGAVYLALKYVFSYWKRKGFPFIEPTLLFGNLGPCTMHKCSLGTNIRDLYEKSSEPIVGIYCYFRPALLVCDAELVKSMLTTDFASFHDRGIFNGDPKTDPIAENILSMEGQKWKTVRNKISPTFTSGKLRAMIPSVLRIGEKLSDKLDLSAANAEIIDIKELSVR